jgi:hypothetical protein
VSHFAAQMRKHSQRAFVVKILMASVDVSKKLLQVAVI